MDLVRLNLLEVFQSYFIFDPFIDALAAVSNKPEPSHNLESLTCSDSNREMEKPRVVEEERDPENEDDESGSIEYEYSNQEPESNILDVPQPKKRRIKSMYKGGNTTYQHIP